jgi:hypothetical protein
VRELPPNNELQRTSDGTAAGSPLNSVLALPCGILVAAREWTHDPTGR